VDARPAGGRSGPAPASAREILALAVPALGALAAEPLYVLVDTAIVGHLGTPQLGGLGIASTILLTSASIFVFLAYGTTGSVARRLGAGDHAGAAHLAVQGLWLALGLALVVGTALLVAGPTLIRWLGGEGDVARHAGVYLSISLAGLPALFVTMAGTGYLRGVQDTRTPLVVAATTAVANLVIQVVLIEGFDRGIGASALATVLAQTGGAAEYLRRIVGAARATGASLRPDAGALRRLGRIGFDLFVRTAALRLSLVAATAVAARAGEVPLGGHQIAFEVWAFLALALDALAIAAQALVARDLGADVPDRARATAARLLRWGTTFGVATGLVIAALRVPLAGLFSPDAEVVAVATTLLLWVAVLQPVAGAVFALDGVLIGAGDFRFLARAMAVVAVAFVVAAAAVGAADRPITWLWAAWAGLMLGRLVPLLARLRGGRWAVTGVEPP